MSFRDRLNKIILHDSAGHPGNEINRVMPYHATVFPDGTVHYRDPADPYGAEAPHAFRQNPEAVGIGYSGPSGGQPTPEGMRALQIEIERANKRSGRLEPLPTFGHGEIDAIAKRNPFDINRASRDGRPLTEASWRNRANDLHQIPETGLPELSLLPKDPPASPFIAAAPQPPLSRVAAAAPAPDPKQEPVPIPKPAVPMTPVEKPPEEKPSPFAATPKPAAQGDSFGQAAAQAHAQAAQAGQRTALEWASRRRPIKGLSTLNDQLFGA